VRWGGRSCKWVPRASLAQATVDAGSPSSCPRCSEPAPRLVPNHPPVSARTSTAYTVTHVLMSSCHPFREVKHARVAPTTRRPEVWGRRREQNPDQCGAGQAFSALGPGSACRVSPSDHPPSRGGQKPGLPRRSAPMARAQPPRLWPQGQQTASCPPAKSPCAPRGPLASGTARRHVGRALH
jgi:hypothetical protein